MNRIERAGLTLFAAAVLFGQGCSTGDERHEVLDLGGRVFTERFSCNETVTGQPTFCPDLNRTDPIQFTSTGLNTYEVRVIPDTGFVINGSLIGLAFHWNGSSPNGYTESGTWTFSSGGGDFAGPSHYVATDASYSGDCNTNGEHGLSSPPNPPLPTGCP